MVELASILKGFATPDAADGPAAKLVVASYAAQQRCDKTFGPITSDAGDEAGGDAAGNGQRAALTAQLDVVARCVKDDPGCYDGLNSPGQRPWSHTFTAEELPVFNDGNATMSLVQTSPDKVRLGVTTLIITTGVPPVVPTLSPIGLLALLASMGLAGLWAVRHRRSA